MGSIESGTPADQKPQLKLLLAAPRGFCAGVVRAIDTVEAALQKFGKPVYVRHEIVHNRYVVERLEQMGAVFIDDLKEAPAGAHVIFSAHGVPKSVPVEARARGLSYFDATCPLVSKVHVEAARHHRAGRQLILIGHEGHPEVEGTMGQLPDGAILLVETVEDVAKVNVSDENRLAYITQTTLSVDDTVEIIAALRARFPNIAGPHKEDICYATTNRQESMRAIAPRSDVVLVVGAPNSSNSMRLVEVAKHAGAKRAALIQRAGEIDWTMLEGVQTVGISAGASAPEILVDEVIAAFRERYEVKVEEVTVRREDVTFNVPRKLAS